MNRYADRQPESCRLKKSFAFVVLKFQLITQVSQRVGRLGQQLTRIGSAQGFRKENLVICEIVTLSEYRRDFRGRARVAEKSLSRYSGGLGLFPSGANSLDLKLQLIYGGSGKFGQITISSSLYHTLSTRAIPER